MTKMTASYTEKLTEIEKCLQLHSTEISKIRKLVDTNAVKLDDAFTLITEWRSGELERNNTMKEISDKVDSIVNIKVNGYIGLQDVLIALLKATKKKRSTQRMFESIKEWCYAHDSLIKICKSKLCQNIFIIFFTWLMLSILSEFVDINIIDIIKSILKIN